MGLKFRPAGVLFDFDGTLIEFEQEFLYEQTERILEILGHRPIEREQLADTFSSFDFFRFVDPLHHPLEDFMERFWSHYEWNTFPEPRAIKGAAELLADLHAKEISTGIVTARLVPTDDIWRDLEKINCHSYIHHIVTRPSKEVDWKDKRGSIQLACQQLNLNPSKTIFVGDIPPDITSARDAGVGCTVAVASGGIKRDILSAAKPDLLLEGVQELHDLLRQVF